MGDCKETNDSIDCSNSMSEGSVNTEGLTAGPGIMLCEQEVGFRRVVVTKVMLTLLSIKLPIWDKVKLHVTRTDGSTITPLPKLCSTD
jgi:hypothetical protein